MLVRTLKPLWRKLAPGARGRADSSLGRALVDGFGRPHTYLRISLTERCNLRCKYCMPAEGVELQPADRLLADDEIVRLAAVFARNGVNRVRLTGGEPLVRRGVESIVEQVAALPGVESVGITTNGMLLERKLPALVRAGLTSVNVSLDTLVAAKFEFITRRRGHDRVLRAVDAALEAGVQTVKINCVVMRGVNDDELSTFVELTRRRPVEVRFIEYMPFSDNAWKEASFLPYGDMLRSVTEVYPSLRKEVDGPHDTAKSYRVPGFAGTLGFISSMSDNFCAGCNRVRLTADGNLKVCLFGTEEVSLRDPLRAGAGEEQLAAIIAAALGRKHAVLGGHGDRHGIAASSENRPMILIGG